MRLLQRCWAIHCVNHLQVSTTSSFTFRLLFIRHDLSVFKPTINIYDQINTTKQFLRSSQSFNCLDTMQRVLCKPCNGKGSRGKAYLCPICNRNGNGNGTVRVPCTMCHETGFRRCSHHSNSVRCKDCIGGNGRVQCSGCGGTKTRSVTCAQCKGAKIIAPPKCPYCNGHGTYTA